MSHIPTIIAFTLDGEPRAAFWSGTADAPGGAGTIDEMRAYVKEEWGRRGLADLEDKLDRALKGGTSSYRDDLRGIISYNRDGHDERCLSPLELFTMLALGVDAPEGVGHEHDSLGGCFTCAICSPGVSGADMPSPEDIGIEWLEAAEMSSRIDWVGRNVEAQDGNE